MTKDDAKDYIREWCPYDRQEEIIKALEQEPCDKCVYSTSEGCQYDDITETIPPFETSDNAISRQEVEEMIKAEMPERGMWEIEGDKEKETVCEVCVDLIQKLSQLPPVTPQPKIGHWLSCAEEYGKPVKWICSSCRDIKSITKNKTEYCPVCGARLGMTDKEIVDKLTELTVGSILNLKDAMDLFCEIKRILSRRDRSE